MTRAVQPLDHHGDRHRARVRHVDGALVTLTGTKFTLSVDVQVNGLSRGYSIDDDAHVTFSMPSTDDLGIDSGEVTVQVVGGEDPSLARATFRYDALTVAYLNPNDVPVSGAGRSSRPTVSRSTVWWTCAWTT